MTDEEFRELLKIEFLTVYDVHERCNKLQAEVEALREDLAEVRAVRDQLEKAKAALEVSRNFIITAEPLETYPLIKIDEALAELGDLIGSTLERGES